jgi:hypothetical protein
MYGLIYFDVEDFISPPDSPVHQLPGKMAEIMRQHGLTGCFHIQGEKARFMERHKQIDVIGAIRKHDVSLHYDRGSIHPTTAEEVSELDWFSGIERTIFRELPGFQSLERIFGKCSSLTQHGGMFASQIVYAAGKMGKPFFYSPFRLAKRNVVWFCNNLLIGGHYADFYFDRFYRDTPAFNDILAKVNPYLEERSKTYDFTALFGCHPVMTIMQQFPDALNFKQGASPHPRQWIAPEMVAGVSISLVLKNFERLIATLACNSNVRWTTVAGIQDRYGMHPVNVRDADVLAGARAVIANGGPAWTATLSAAELLFLLAQRTLMPKKVYHVPQVMGPLEESKETFLDPGNIDVKAVALEIVEYVRACGYLPHKLCTTNEKISPEYALMLLACHALGYSFPSKHCLNLSITALPGAAVAAKNVKEYGKWSIHGPRFNQSAIMKHFLLQCWTLKPAFTVDEYEAGIELGRHLNPMFENDRLCSNLSHTRGVPQEKFLDIQKHRVYNAKFRRKNDK